MKVIYVAGLPRSGSTIFHHLLAANPDAVSLGEILGAIRTERDPSHAAAGWPCSCGRTRYECSFWGGVFPLPEFVSPWDDYGRVVANFREKYPNRVLVDASKAGEPVLSFYRRAEVDLRVVLLVRDVRGWIRSYQRAIRAMETWRPVMDNYVACAYRWMMSNLRFVRRLGESGVSWTLLSYDRLMSDPEGEAARLSSALDFSVPRAPQEAATVHELLGSPALRARANESLRFQYDESWRGDWRSIALAPLMLPVLLMNRRIRGE